MRRVEDSLLNVATMLVCCALSLVTLGTGTVVVVVILRTMGVIP